MAPLTDEDVLYGLLPNWEGMDHYRGQSGLQHGLLDDVANYGKRVVTGQIAMQGLNNLDTLMQRAIAGDMQAKLELGMQFTPGAILSTKAGRGVAGLLDGGKIVGMTDKKSVGDGIIKVFHGSPNRFTKFDLSKVGAGAGAQTEGYGAYLTDVIENAKRFAQGKRGHVYQTTIPSYGNIPDATTASSLQKALYDNDALGLFKQNAIDSPEFWESARAYLKNSISNIGGFSDRKMPLTMSERKKFIDELAKNQYALNSITNSNAPTESLLQTYRRLASLKKSQKAASDYFVNSGIDGLLFPPGSGDMYGSLGGNNYVIFSQKLLDEMPFAPVRD